MSALLLHPRALISRQRSRSRFEDVVACVWGNTRSYAIAFEYPRLWAPVGSDIQFVDSNSSAITYEVVVALPDDESVESLDKKWFGGALFDPEGKS